MEFDPDLGIEPTKLLLLQRAIIDISEPLAIRIDASVPDVLFALLANACDLLQGSAPEVRAALADRALAFIHRNCGVSHAELVATQIQRAIERSENGTLTVIKPAGSA